KPRAEQNTMHTALPAHIPHILARMLSLRVPSELPTSLASDGVPKAVELGEVPCPARPLSSLRPEGSGERHTAAEEPNIVTIASTPFQAPPISVRLFAGPIRSSPQGPL